MKKLLLVGFFLIAAQLSSYAQEAMIGEVRLFAGNFAPRGWALCEGQLLPINENQALFSILGTMYGGDGRTTFALPDLRGRAPIGVGRASGLKPMSVGQRNNGISIKSIQSENSDSSTQATLGMHYIIAVTGLYPSRG